MKYSELIKLVLNENLELLTSIDETEVNLLVEKIIRAKKIIGYGAGRMGFGLKAFIMRLNHLGKDAYFFGDNFVPRFDKDDLIIVTSGSGNTKSVLNILEIAINKAGCDSFAITGNNKSPMATLANNSLTFKSCNGGLNSADDPSKITSIQPMSTLNEQGMFLLFDIISLKVIEKLGLSLEETKQFHANIE
jgi:6-phospho-3-hexuloisomerase